MAITTIQLKRAVSSVWSQVNPVLLCGELGYETDTNLLKIGDGEHSWTELGYLTQHIVTETHELTAEEADTKRFNLNGTVASGHEDSVLAIVGGVAQIAGEDFEVNGSEVSWNGKGLEEIELITGDKFIVQYTGG